MCKAKTLLVAVIMLLSASGLLAAGSASARLWEVGKPLKELTQGAANGKKVVNLKLKGKAELKATVFGVEGTVSCETAALAGGKIWNAVRSVPTVGDGEGVIELTKCTSTCGKATEPIKLPEAGKGESLLTEEKKLGTPILQALLPGENTKVFMTVHLTGCLFFGSIAVEANVNTVGRQGYATEGEGAVTSTISPEGASVKKTFVMKCPALKAAWNWYEQEIKIGELTSSACLKAEFEAELEGGEEWGVGGSAAANEFASETGAYPVTKTGTSGSVKLIEDGVDSVTCKKASYSTTLEGTSPTMSVTPTYSECAAVVSGKEFEATVADEGCHYEYSNLEEDGVKEDLKASIAVAGCTGGIKIEVPGAGCKFELPHQGPDAGAFFTDHGEEGRESKVEVKEASINSTCAGVEANPHIWQFVMVGLHILLEVIFDHFETVPAPVIQFKPGEKRSITVKNPNWLILAYINDRVRNGWAGDRGTCPVPGVYPHNSSCVVELTAPASCGTVTWGAYEIFGVIWSRGVFSLECK